MMPNKECSRIQMAEPKGILSPVQQVASQASVKTAVVPAKVAVVKALVKEPISPTPPEPDRMELLGSLTTLQQQRTSARVIKKLRLEPLPDKDKPIGKRDGDDAECDTLSKIDEKDLKFPTVKHRMPKALWSTDEKNLFFEALNEYGKDFDAITAYICAKMKKKGMNDANLKTKTQVSHFYYRTWHKLSKHVHFDENVKKVAQELYALINYGELRKKLVSVNEKTCARLGEMVLRGGMAVRARGRTLRVRTPLCRALRKLNQITERACGSRVCSRAQVCLRARDAAGWARVQAAAHNPRAHVALPLRARLAALIAALGKRWAGHCNPKVEKVDNTDDLQNKDPEEYMDDEDEEDHLGLDTDRMITQEQKMQKKPVLHVGPRPTASIHIPVVSPSEPLSSHKICFSSYLERMRDKDGSDAKIRTPKRQRKDSATDKDKDVDPKKFKVDDEVKFINIDETAIDGIELMASYKNLQDDEEKPSTEDEKEMRSEEVVEEEIEIPEREKDSEKEKDSFSEMEDDEKYNKSDTDNESDHGKEKSTKESKFKNLKVKFRIRPKIGPRGGSTYTVVLDKEEDIKIEEPCKEEDNKQDIDIDTATRQVRKGWSVYDAGDLTIGDLYLMFGSRSKLELDYWWAEPTPPLPKAADSLPPAVIDRDKKEKVDKTPDKDEESEKARESDTDIFSPKNAFSQDSNDGLSGDERKSEQLASPDHKSSSSSNATLKLVNKLINRPGSVPSTAQNGFSQLSDRLKRLLALAGNPHISSSAASTIARCNCGHICPQRRQAQKQSVPQMVLKTEESAVFRHPTPIAPKAETEQRGKPLSLSDVPRWRRGRPRADRRVVVQRLLPLLPKLPPPSNLIPVKIVPNSPPAPPRILPKPPPTSTSDLSFFYVLSESNGQFYFHDGDRKIPISPPPSNGAEVAIDKEGIKEEYGDKDMKCEPEQSTDKEQQNGEDKNQNIANFLPSESMSLSPSRLLRESEGEWLDGAVHDFSLSSFLHHLDTNHSRPPDLAVESQLQSLMAESSVDYMAKFADLAAEVTDPSDPLPSDDLT